MPQRRRSSIPLPSGSSAPGSVQRGCRRHFVGMARAALGAMRRLGLVLILALVIVAGLVASGVIRVHVDVRPPSGVEAKPFWREKAGTAALPDALGIWVEIARAVRPAVVNVST